MFHDEHESMVSFPLTAYDKRDWSLEYLDFILPRAVSRRIAALCKRERCRISPLLQYVANAAVIESHAQLEGDFYRSVLGNTFSTIAMYKRPRRVHIGFHASAQNSLMEYHRRMPLKSAAFWTLMRRLSRTEVVDGNIVALYRNKFPVFNFKKFVHHTWDDLIGARSMGPPTISNPGKMALNREGFALRMTECNFFASPAVGWGGAYLLVLTTIADVAEWNVAFNYGRQFFDKQTAHTIVGKIREKLEFIGSSETNHRAKL